MQKREENIRKHCLCRFVVWALALPCALFGYFVPFVHLVGVTVWVVS